MNERKIENALQYIDFIEGERWAVIPNYSNYLISNIGRIFGFKHKAVKNVKKYKGVKYLTTRLIDDNGVLSNSIYIHRLVAEVFVNNPDNKTIVDHIDGNKLNN